MGDLLNDDIHEHEGKKKEVAMTTSKRIGREAAKGGTPR
jgi:hypothetical protein